MESSNTALRRKNDAAAERELRELREDTLKGLDYLRALVNAQCSLAHGRIVNNLRPNGTHTHFDPSAQDTLDAAIVLLKGRWSA